MSLKIRPLRYAHSEGHTDMCFSGDGNQIITCGNDGDIRVWAGSEDDEPESYCVGEGAYSVVQKNDYLYVCSDDSKVLMLKYPSCERDGLLTRFTAPGTHITIAKNAPVLAVVSEDFSVKVLNLPQDTNATTFSDLSGPALHVSLSPNGKILAVSCGDGKMYIWNLESKTLIKHIDCVPYSNNFVTTKILCRTSFDPKGKFLAYPYHKEVFIVGTDQFQKVCTLSSNEIKNSLSIAQFSPCGKYIAASSQDGEVCVWHFQSKTVIGTASHPEKNNICSLHWNPKDNGEITFCDVNGQIGTIEVAKNADEITTTEIEENMDIPLDFVDDEDNENAISVEKLKNETLRPMSANSLSLSNDNPSRAQSPMRPRTPPINLQPPFQPSSTPTHLVHRFMVYNDVGTIQAFNDGESSIDIQFHDVNISRNIYMKNVLNHTMASLSTKVIALACDTPSKLVCIPVEASTKQWTVEMSELEEILCVTASTNLVAVATDTRFLRVFSIYGTQRAVLSLPGPVVALASHKNQLLAIFHASTSYSKDQNLGSMLITFEGLNIKSTELRIPLTPESTLTWVGFSDCGSVATYDSSGILRQYNTSNGIWIPIFDANMHAKGASDSYFITNVSEAAQIVGAIHCKGNMYPATTPRPILMELPMQAMLSELDTDKATLEERVFRWSQNQVTQPENSFKEAVIKLFVLACKSELDERALELLTLVSSTQLTSLGLKYANRLNRKRLVDKLTELLHYLENADENEEENDENTPSMSNGTPQSTYKGSQSNETQSQDLFRTPVANSTLINTQDVIFSKAAAGNPFKKGRTTTEVIKKNPLGLTDVTSEVNLPSTSTSTDKAEPVSANTIAPLPKETFVGWFSKEKTNLEQKHPDLSPSELTQMALKMFKSNSEKRKASDEVDGSKTKQRKLSAFAFAKNK